MYKRAVHNNLLESYQECIKILKGLGNYVRSKKDTNIIEFVNTMQFITVNSFDMATMIMNIDRSQSKIEKNLFARILATICYQIMEEYRHIAGKKFREAVCAISDDDESAISNLNLINKQFSEFCRNNSKYFKLIRNNVLAHRNKNLMMQIRFIEKTDIKEIEKKALSLGALTNNYIHYFGYIFKNFLNNEKELVANYK